MKTPNELAWLISNSISIIEKERKRKTTRFQITTKSLKELSKRQSIGSHYISEFYEEMLNFGWCCFQINPTQHCVVKRKSAESWVKLSSKRFAGTILEEKQ